MPAIELTTAERRAHRADAHLDQPMGLQGGVGFLHNGRRQAVVANHDNGVQVVRVLGDDRAAREAIFAQLCDQLDAAPIQHIGKLLVLWRPIPEKDTTDAAREGRGAGPREVKILKFSKSGTRRPEIKKVKVLGNQRVTAGGLVKRAKPRLSSKKKSG